MQVLTRVQPSRKRYVTSLLFGLFQRLQEDRLHRISNDAVAPQVEKGFEVNGCIHGYRDELCPSAHVGEFPCPQNGEHSQSSALMRPGNAMSHTNRPSSKRRSIHRSRA